jgi:hypothetical protein
VNGFGGLSIRGGFASCTATLPTGRSTILGDNSSRALFVAVGVPTTLDNLTLTGGSVASNGGGVWLGAVA